MSGPSSGSKPGRPSPSEWRALLGHFPHASWDLLQRRELRHRSDSKYVLRPGVAMEVLARLRPHYAVLPTSTDPLPLYRTLYFDTPELDLFHAHRRGRRVRHKVRIRHYADRRLSRLEVKTRQSELETYKVSREIRYGTTVIAAEDAEFVALHSGIGRPLTPQVCTSFRRATLLGLASGERVTLDLQLTVERGHLARALDGVAILEVKQWPFCRSTPVMQALRQAGQRPRWASKYCLAIALTHPEVPANTLLPGLREFQRAAA